MEETTRQPLKGDFQAMYSPLGSLIRRQPVTVPLDSTVRQAIKVMDEKRIGSIIIAEGSLRLPLGIFTLRDLLHRVALPGCTLDLPIAAVMTRGRPRAHRGRMRQLLGAARRSSLPRAKRGWALAATKRC